MASKPLLTLETYNADFAGNAGISGLNRKLRVLLEMRPAIGGHAGIPQATRLLFRSLLQLNAIDVEGLIQSSGQVLKPGLPTSTAVFHKSLSADQELNRLGRVVISLEQGPWDYYSHATALTILMICKHAVGGSQRLTRFPAKTFRDFLWRRFFERTLPPEDFNVVTGAAFRIAQIPWGAMHIGALVTRKLGCAVYPRLDTSDFDVMISETPYPASVSRNTQLIVHYHDAIPLLMPHTISDRRWHQAFHYHALRKNVDSGAWFACVSEATRTDLLSFFPQLEARSVTIPNAVSHDYFDEPSTAARVPEIIMARLTEKIKPPLTSSTKRKLFEAPKDKAPLQYLLIVSTVEPRKNHLSLLTAWERLRVEHSEQLKLIVVGALGWHHEPTIRRLRPWLERLEAFLLSDLLSSELRLLYRHAQATICPSIGEGFDFSGIEAMKSGGVVVASDIPVHREIYRDAALYFNPYDVADLAMRIQTVMSPAHAAHRAELVARGSAVASLYGHEVITPKWESFLETFRARMR